MRNQLRSLIILVIVLLALGIGSAVLYHARYATEYGTTDPDSGQTLLHNSVTNHDTPTIQVYASQTLLDKGMTTEQFTTLRKTLGDTVTSLYPKKYSVISINTASTTYNSSTNQYSFKVRLGDAGSKTYVFVTADTVDAQTIHLVIKDDSGKVLKETSVSVTS